MQPANPSWVAPLDNYVKNGVDKDLLACCPLPPKRALPDSELEFGTTLRGPWFDLPRDFAFLNHGSYGAALRPCRETQRFYTDELERQPLMFMDDVVLPLLAEALRTVSEFVGAKPGNLIFVPNATYSANAVLKSMALHHGDAILCASTTYGAVKNAMLCSSSLTDATVLVVPANPEADPLGDAFVADVEAKLEEAAAQGLRVRLAIFDHICSRPPWVMPVERLCKLCKSRNVRVLVDGAHAIGATKLNLEELGELGCDYYTSNCHKWLCTPKCSAILWVSPACQPQFHSLITSHGYKASFLADSMWMGTMDYGALLSVPYAVSFFRTVGEERVYNRNSALVRWAANMLTAKWNTTAPVISHTMAMIIVPEAAARTVGLRNTGPLKAIDKLVTVRVPQAHLVKELKWFEAMVRHASGVADEAATRMHYALRIAGIEVSVSPWLSSSSLAVRISAHVHNSEWEYERLATAVLEIAARAEKPVAHLSKAKL
eukprot:TRINITY_DN5563_c0_g2_i1.p1 TRINITY_DN5563_c0_g2~~TRINITY_DN5563_c0_g2_i1.p1  ORF type:complete len:498 (-),score=65.00 TRINITY_DN5563_c0_g2_i1:1446-2912(-)